MWHSWKMVILMMVILCLGLFVIVPTFISSKNVAQISAMNEHLSDEAVPEIFPFSPNTEVEIWRDFECLSTFTGYHSEDCPEARPNLHTGIDFLTDIGTPILSVSTGIVTHAGPYTTDTSDCTSTDSQPGGAMMPQNDYGLEIIIEDGDYQFIYLHLRAVEVESGTQITSVGQQIGYVGSRGCDSIPHLHFEIQYKGEPIDPAQYLASQKSDSN